MSKLAKKSSLTDLQQQVAQLTEALKRERADAANVRRRAEEDKLQAANFYKAVIVRDLLPVIDNCERLLEHISAISEDSPLKEGAEKIVQQSYKVLADLGIERIKTVGEEFDPKLHEAISVDMSPEALAKGEDVSGLAEVVCEELASGYKIGDEIIRHALVKVKKGE